jgi:hypothetical protein
LMEMYTERAEDKRAAAAPADEENKNKLAK